jgi:hypothetical protein
MDKTHYGGNLSAQDGSLGLAEGRIVFLKPDPIPLHNGKKLSQFETDGHKPGLDERQLCSSINDLSGEQVQPMPEKLPSFPVHCFVTVRFHQLGGAIRIACSQSVFERFLGESTLLEPLTGTRVGWDNFVSAELVPQPLPQKVAEQVVVTVPSGGKMIAPLCSPSPSGCFSPLMMY